MHVYNYVISNKCLLWISSPSLQGWGYSGFQVMGMIEWGQKSKPKEIPRASNKTPQKIPGPTINPPKIPGPKINPPKIPCAFLSLKNLQKALNDITWKIWTTVECLCLFIIHHTIWIYRMFWIPPKIPYSKHPQKMLAKFFHPKNSSQSKISNPKNPSIIPITWNLEYPSPPAGSLSSPSIS